MGLFKEQQQIREPSPDLFRSENRPLIYFRDLLRLQYGIGNVMDVQNLEKKQRNKIIKELCNQGAGFRQLARITGISYGIIQRAATDQRTVP